MQESLEDIQEQSCIINPQCDWKKKKSKVCLQWFSDIENLGLNQGKLDFGVKARKGKTDKDLNGTFWPLEGYRKSKWAGSRKVRLYVSQRTLRARPHVHKHPNITWEGFPARLLPNNSLRAAARRHATKPRCPTLDTPAESHAQTWNTEFKGKLFWSV